MYRLDSIYEKNKPEKAVDLSGYELQTISQLQLIDAQKLAITNLLTTLIPQETTQPKDRCENSKGEKIKWKIKRDPLIQIWIKFQSK